MLPTLGFSAPPATRLPEAGGLLVADAQPLVRGGLRHVLTQSFPAYPLREASTAARLTELVQSQRPDLVLMAANLPDAFDEPHRVLTALRDLQPRLPVMVLIDTATATELAMRRLVRQHVNGLLQRTAAAPEISQAVATVLQYGQHYDAFVLDLLQRPVPRSLPPRAPAIFSPRQLEVLRLIADDHSNEDIAEYLGISIRTAEYHRSQMLHKSGTRTTLALVLFARRQGLLHFSPGEPAGALVPGLQCRHLS